jgi:hypothetical protein
MLVLLCLTLLSLARRSRPEIAAMLRDMEQETRRCPAFYVPQSAFFNRLGEMRDSRLLREADPADSSIIMQEFFDANCRLLQCNRTEPKKLFSSGCYLRIFLGASRAVRRR